MTSYGSGGSRLSQFDELPEGWSLEEIQNLCDFNPKHSKDLPDDLEISFIPMPAVDDVTGTIQEHGTRPLGEVRKGYTHFAEKDVIFAKITPCMENGKAAVAKELINGIACGSTEFHVLRSNGSVLPDYVYRYLRQQSYRDNAAQAMTGAVGQRRVPKQFVLGTKLPLPPLNEQRRIVEKVEALTARSRKAREALAAIPELLAQFRQSVLAAAFRGDLTADWRAQNPDVEPAEALLEWIRVERRKRWEKAELEKMRAKGKEPTNDKWKAKYKEPNFEEYDLPDDLPESWAGAYIGEIADCLDSVRVPINKDERARREGDIPYYGANGQVGWIDDYLFDENLVIVVEDETFIGRTKPFSYKITGRSWVNNHAHVLRPLGGMSADFLNYSLMFYPFIPLTSGTTGRRKLTQKSLLAAPYKLPPLREQKQIVARIKKYFDLADSLQNELEDGLGQYETLDQSILAKAFRGELVPQDPTDEPAAVLLARIRAERDKLNPQRQGKKTPARRKKANP
jgi:type I restriction enzyme S subunit